MRLDRELSDGEILSSDSDDRGIVSGKSYSSSKYNYEHDEERLKKRKSAEHSRKRSAGDKNGHSGSKDSSKYSKSEKKKNRDENTAVKRDSNGVSKKSRHRSRSLSSDLDYRRKNRLDERSHRKESRRSHRDSSSDDHKHSSRRKRDGMLDKYTSDEVSRRAKELEKYVSKSHRSRRERSPHEHKRSSTKRSSRSKKSRKEEVSSEIDDTNYDNLLENMDFNEDELVAKRREERKALLAKISANPTEMADKLSDNFDSGKSSCQIIDPDAVSKDDQCQNIVETDNISPVISVSEEGNTMLGAGIYDENADTDDKRFLTLGTKFWENEKSSNGLDMFCEDDVDISQFNGISQNKHAGAPAQEGRHEVLQDTWDDNEGYYKVQIGEVMADKFSIFGVCGKGVFSNVVRARMVEDEAKIVCIKLIRNNDLMLRQGRKELETLRLLNDNDPNDKYHCMRMYDHFYYRNHLCIVLEPMYLNLRELVRNYGGGIGLNITAVRSYSQQLLQAIKYLRRMKLIHADIKPDNIMVNTQKKYLKLCDFGSVLYEYEVEITPYLVSRFYRAPEIMLGLKYDYAIDLWSTACSIYELFTGKILFPGKTNNEMIKLMMDLKGKFTHKMLRKGTLTYDYFDENLNFMYRESSKIMEREKITLINNVKACTDISKLLKRFQSGDQNEHIHVQNLADLLDKMLLLDPTKRISAAQCLQHPFIVEK